MVQWNKFKRLIVPSCGMIVKLRERPSKSCTNSNAFSQGQIWHTGAPGNYKTQIYTKGSSKTAV